MKYGSLLACCGDAVVNTVSNGELIEAISVKEWAVGTGTRAFEKC